MLKEGDRVVATRIVTEGGCACENKCNCVIDRSAKFPDYDYIHAEEGEAGIIENIDDCNGDLLPTVRFDRTGTATLVGWDEIKLKEVK